MGAASPAPTGPSDPAPKGILGRYWWVAGLAMAGLVIVLAAIFASGDPDGLNAVAIEQGFATATTDPGVAALPGYTIPGLDGPASTIVAGVVGIAVVFVLMLLLGRLLARRRKDRVA